MGSRVSIVILANPKSGRYRVGRVQSIVDGLGRADHDVTLQVTQSPGEIEVICADRSVVADTFVIAGGDGSINEAIRGFNQRPRPHPSIAVIPSGTANVLANEIGLPRRAAPIVKMIATNRTRRLYHGLANGNPFILMASAGYDAEVVSANPRPLKRRLGSLSYLLTAMALRFRRTGHQLSVCADGQLTPARMAVVTNISRYGGRFTVCPDASIDRPELYLATLQSDDPMSIYRFGFHLVTNTIPKASGVTIRRAKRVEITADDPVACQADGDSIGTTPLVIEQTDNWTRIVVP
jgi:diacylglycerol kinase (ATP)